MRSQGVVEATCMAPEAELRIVAGEPQDWRPNTGTNWYTRKVDAVFSGEDCLGQLVTIRDGRKEHKFTVCPDGHLVSPGHVAELLPLHNSEHPKAAEVDAGFEQPGEWTQSQAEESWAVREARAGHILTFREWIDPDGTARESIAGTIGRLARAIGLEVISEVATPIIEGLREHAAAAGLRADVPPLPDAMANMPQAVREAWQQFHSSPRPSVRPRAWNGLSLPIHKVARTIRHKVGRSGTMHLGRHGEWEPDP